MNDWILLVAVAVIAALIIGFVLTSPGMKDATSSHGSHDDDHGHVAAQRPETHAPGADLAHVVTEAPSTPPATVSPARAFQKVAEMDAVAAASASASEATLADELFGDGSYTDAELGDDEIAADLSGGAEDAVTEAPVLTEPEVEAVWDGPFGPGSAEASEDGSGPRGWTVKGARQTKVYLVPDDAVYEAARANVWFVDEQRAIDAGFTRWQAPSS